jgi:hypothetical protein
LFWDTGGDDLGACDLTAALSSPGTTDTTSGTSTTGTTTGTIGTTTGVDTSTTGIGGDQAKVCVLRHEHGKNYHWVWDVEVLHLGDKVVKDKACDEDNNRRPREQQQRSQRQQGE